MPWYVDAVVRLVKASANHVISAEVTVLSPARFELKSVLFVVVRCILAFSSMFSWP